jgi:hypothetical protein
MVLIIPDDFFQVVYMMRCDEVQDYSGLPDGYLGLGFLVDFGSTTFCLVVVLLSDLVLLC